MRARCQCRQHALHANAYFFHSSFKQCLAGAATKAVQKDTASDLQQLFAVDLTCQRGLARVRLCMRTSVTTILQPAICLQNELDGNDDVRPLCQLVFGSPQGTCLEAATLVHSWLAVLSHLAELAHSAEHVHSRNYAQQWFAQLCIGALTAIHREHKDACASAFAAALLASLDHSCAPSLGSEGSKAVLQHLCSCFITKGR